MTEDTKMDEKTILKLAAQMRELMQEQDALEERWRTLSAERGRVTERRERVSLAILENERAMARVIRGEPEAEPDIDGIVAARAVAASWAG